MSAPTSPRLRTLPHERLRVLPEQTEWLEQRCDEVNATLEPLSSFVLSEAPRRPRSCTSPHRLPPRRATRRRLGAEVSPETLRYLNRLTDLLFILARDANQATNRSGSRAAFADSPGRRSLTRRPVAVR